MTTSLPASALYRSCDAAKFGFETTAELEPLDDALGQARAVEALRFGLSIRREGYNLFAIGPEGTGKRTLIDRLTRKRASGEPTPLDWIYVNDFDDPRKPAALSLPPGRGAALRQDMRALIEDLRAALPAAFESDDYRARRQAIDDVLKDRQEKAFRQVEKHARELNVGILRTPMGITLAPIKDGEVVAAEEFHKRPEEEQERIRAVMNQVQEELQAVFQQATKWDSERRDKIHELHREVTRAAIGFRLDGLNRRYADLANVVEHLKVVARDLVENAEQFLMQAAGPEGSPELAGRRAMPEGGPFDRYRINLLVDHSGNHGAPVVVENHPTLQNLIGNIEYRPQFGHLVTDFSLIRPGALHLANGGYLILDARRVLLRPFAWEELKRALQAREILIRSPADTLGILSTVTLQPVAIPLSTKVILTGDRMLYYLLAAYDPDFEELFKVAADFDDDVERDAGSETAYARFVASICKRETLLPLDRHAVARTVEHGARLAGEAEKMTARIETVADLLREADHIAREAGERVVGASAVQSAIDKQIHRASRVRLRMQDEIRRGTVLIDTAGAKVGQVNGLSVFQLGSHAFGRPSRITASVRLGRGQVVDIEREVKLGGPIHSKGVLILGGFLGGRFGRDRPLALSASLVFEQSYGGVEGDSASMAELCAILSALSGVPIRQGFAITGSVNQNGEAQAIGGVNEKIEGFFDVCRAMGPQTGQGVVIPASNVKHLMLRRDVVAAVEAGTFAVHAVRDVDEAIQVLTGVESGARDASGKYPADSVNGKTEAALAAFAEAARRFAASDGKERAP